MVSIAPAQRQSAVPTPKATRHEQTISLAVASIPRPTLPSLPKQRGGTVRMSPTRLRLVPPSSGVFAPRGREPRQSLLFVFPPRPDPWYKFPHFRQSVKGLEWAKRQ